MEIEAKDGKVRVVISADLTPEELRELIAKLAQAHGDATGCRTVDTGIPIFESLISDVRPINGGVQLSLLSVLGWSQRVMLAAQAEVLLLDIRTSLGGVPTGTVLS